MAPLNSSKREKDIVDFGEIFDPNNENYNQEYLDAFYGAEEAVEQPEEYNFFDDFGGEVGGYDEDQFQDQDQEEEEEEGEGEEILLEDEEEEEENNDYLAANAIIHNLQLDLPEMQDILPQPTRRQKTVKMTDIGFQMSRMMLKGKDAFDGDSEQQNSFIVEDESYKNVLEEMRGGRDGEEEIEEGQDELLEAEIHGRRGRKKLKMKTGVRGRPKGSKGNDSSFKRSSTPKLAPEVSRLMGRANTAYVQQNYRQAANLYIEVIRCAPEAPEPYYTLGMIYEEQGDLEKAASYLIISAHLTKADSDLWVRIAELLLRIPKRKTQAIYCLERAIKTRDFRPELFWMRSKLYLEEGQFSNAITSFVSLLKVNMNDLGLFRQVAKLALKMNLAYIAANMFTSLFRGSARIGQPFTWSHLNLLVELREFEDDFDNVASGIEEFVVLLSSERLSGASTDWFIISREEQLQRALTAMPVELRAKWLIARLNLRLPVDVKELTSILNENEIGTDLQGYGKLRLSGADGLFDAGAYSEALQVYLPLMDHPGLGTPALCLKIGQCYRRLGHAKMAIETFLAILELEPEHREARLSLSEIYRSIGQTELAIQIIQGVDNAGEGEDKTKNDSGPNWESLDLIYRGVLDGVGLDLSSSNAVEVKDTGSDSDSDYEEDEEDEDDYSEDEGGAILNLRPRSANRRKLKFGHERRRRLRYERIHKRKPVEYDEEEMAKMQNDYKQVLSLYDRLEVSNGDDDRSVLERFMTLGLTLLQNFLDNPAVFPDRPHVFRAHPPHLPALHGLSISEWGQVILRVLHVSARQGDYEQVLKHLKTILLASALNQNIPLTRILRLLQIVTAGRLGKTKVVLNAVRWFLSRYPSHAEPYLIMRYFLLQLPNGLLAYYQPVFFRFLCRTAEKYPQSIPMQLEIGHEFLETRNYDDAARCYVQARMNLSSADPCSKSSFLDLCLANALIWRAFQRTCPNPPIRILQGFAFMFRYVASEDSSPESLFNLARALHMCGMPHLALPYYRKVLDATVQSTDDQSLRVRTVYNLSRLFIQVRSYGMAQELLRQYPITPRIQ